ncbi:MAG: hypothetical protein A4E40_00299 [Methanoregulaceae archaeon PtaU1.Bin059]|nr:MAG: hypothetical protein A4E39_01958 [Methanoregulaceae archaeon PtaB.Bin152]OPY42789.1 MAG: hypothetical protein A4E40_00299 [Methanoregulaceae archaeon PtaU1.Bin059]
MGSNEDIMHDFVRRELKRLYPSVDGWQIKKAPRAGADPGFSISRRLLGRFEGSQVLVSFDRKVTGETVKALKEMAASNPIAGVASPRLILMVPQGAEAAGIPPEVQILPMQSFGFDGKELVWLKRRAQVSEKTTAKSA